MPDYTSGICDGRRTPGFRPSPGWRRRPCHWCWLGRLQITIL